MDFPESAPLVSIVLHLYLRYSFCSCLEATVYAWCEVVSC